MSARVQSTVLASMKWFLLGDWDVDTGITLGNRLSVVSIAVGFNDFYRGYQFGRWSCHNELSFLPFKFRLQTFLELGEHFVKA
jgi:hypothetical protein